MKYNIKKYNRKNASRAKLCRVVQSRAEKLVQNDAEDLMHGCTTCTRRHTHVQKS